MSKDALGKSENSREVTGLVLGSNYVKERLLDLLGDVVSVISGAETVIDSNTLGGEVDGLARGVLIDTSQYKKGKGQDSGDQSSVYHKDDGGEVNSPKGRKWKRMARAYVSKAAGGQIPTFRQKRELSFDSEERQ
ncbi:hypothetical protein ACOSQ4_013378 [Xanthoceras sorbifolium]